MGQVIYLEDRRAARAPAAANETQAGPAFFFDVSCPLSYLTAELVERRLGVVEWVPVNSVALGDGSGARGDLTGRERRRAEAAVRHRAETYARALRLPLVWPERFPADAPCAQRAAAFACEIGAGSAFALAASRLAFCGGFDLEDPETLAEAAAAAGVPLEECLAAAGESWRDEELDDTAAQMRAHGMLELPAFHVRGRWFQGESALTAAEAVLNAPQAFQQSLAPLA